MALRILIDRSKLVRLEPLDAGTIQEYLKLKGYIFDGISCVIADEDKVIIVFQTPPYPIGKVATDLGIKETDIDAFEFDHTKKTRHKLFEGINKRGRFERIELVLE
jgi:hypothetical protein